MEQYYIVIVVVLFALAISDLIVGVSNDAVNFLNSAVGAKAAPFKIILLVASLGVLLGATFSSGMMEVARKGIFHPQEFYFSEIMIIFLAVMLTDIILLDTFNTFGLPTSTTVSIVFELLGSAVSVAMVKILRAGESLSHMSQYINSSKALAIISGILLSVAVAFIVGMVVQAITRLIFSFKYEKAIQRFGSIYGGIAIMAITYFILIKGAKGASFMSDSTVEYIQSHTGLILLYSFIAWTILIQLLKWIFKLDILKFIVLVGTFALAMAFAGNDLVNFIGVPLAGYESFKAWIHSPGPVAHNEFLMSALQEKIKTPTYFLVIAGFVMVLTLFFSRKARKVVQTSVDLSRQYEGEERFGSSFFARSLVRTFSNISMAVDFITPKPIKNWVASRFENPMTVHIKDAASFDMLRASVNLVVASILISFATSLKLPLSTTYVTFMVAMGTSLADGAWGRENAVYRITGVLAVIGGWFFTAFAAFSISFIVALIINYGGPVAIFILILLAIFLVYRTYRKFNKLESEEKDKDLIHQSVEEIGDENIFDHCSTTVVDVLTDVKDLYVDVIKGLSKEKRKSTQQKS